MAIDLNSKSGADQMALEIENEVKKKMRDIAVETYRALVVNTPVYTGRLRWGWEITVGEPSTYCPPEGNYSFPTVDNHSYVQGINFSLDDTLWISNNVPYILCVNEGTSRQQPRRFVEAAIESIRNIAERVN